MDGPVNPLGDGFRSSVLCRLPTSVSPLAFLRVGTGEGWGTAGVGSLHVGRQFDIRGLATAGQASGMRAVSV
jgi:hypothetical protein